MTGTRSQTARVTAVRDGSRGRTDLLARANGRGTSSRPGQLAMAAEAAPGAFGGPGPVSLIEAGTGTGKTLAYLVPALAQRPQDRGFHGHQEPAGTDFPQGHPISCERASGQRHFRAAYLKGRDNYLCLYWFKELLIREPALSPAAHEAVFLEPA